MELKELTSKVIELLNIESPEQIPESLMEIVLNGKIKYFDGFCDLVKDLSIDWLQKIFQFYLADRKVKMQDYTPASLARFVGKLVQAENEHSVYDLCAGSGALTIQKWNLNNELNFVCYEYDKIVIPILLFNLAVRNIDAVVVNGDALQDEVFATYLVRKGDKYSSVKETESFKPQKTDSCISNPPYNMKWKIPPFAQLQPRFNGCELPPESNANYAFILTALDNCNEKVSMILPCGILSSEVTNEKRIRQYLVEKNLIESVILCPDKMFEATSIATCLLTLNKKKETTHIAFLDIRDMTDNDIQNLYKLPTVFFVYKPGYLEKDSAVPIPGLYAEDVEQYLPLAARYQNGLIEDWNERAVIPYLIKAIQLQHEEIEALKRKVA